MPPSAVPSKLIMTQDNTQKVRLFGLKDDAGNFVNNATLTATLVDKDRNDVVGCVSITMVYQTGTNGNYAGTVGPTFKPGAGTEYTMVIDGDGSGAHIHVEKRTEVRVRTN